MGSSPRSTTTIVRRRASRGRCRSASSRRKPNTTVPATCATRRAGCAPRAIDRCWTSVRTGFRPASMDALVTAPVRGRDFSAPLLARRRRRRAPGPASRPQIQPCGRPKLFRCPLRIGSRRPATQATRGPAAAEECTSARAQRMVLSRSVGRQ